MIVRKASSSPATGSPKKLRRSPKKAKFSLKEFLRFSRSDRAKRFREEMSPIQTTKRTGRSASDPVLPVQRVVDFDDHDEEDIANMTEGQREDVGDHRDQSEQTQPPDAVERDGELPACELPVPPETLLPHNAPALGSEFLFELTEKCGRFVSTDDVNRDMTEAMAEDKPSNCSAGSADVTDHRGSGTARDEQDYSRVDVRIPVNPGSEDQRDKVAPGIQPMFPGEDNDNPHSDGFGHEIQQKWDARCSLFEVPVVDKSTLAAHESRPIFNDLGSMNKPSARHQQAPNQKSNLILGLYSIDESEEMEYVSSREEDQALTGSPSQCQCFVDAIPATATHRIRVGVLPGSPIRSPARPQSIEEDEIKTCDGSEERYESNLEVSSGAMLHPDNLEASEPDQVESPTRGGQSSEGMVLIIESHAQAHQGRRVDSAERTFIPDFTPTSPVQVRDAQEVPVWMRHEPEFPDLSDGGDSTWTNSSSNDGESDISPNISSSDLDHREQGAANVDAGLGDADFIAELDQAMDRLSTVITIVNDAIDIASNALGISGENRGAEAVDLEETAAVIAMGYEEVGDDTAVTGITVEIQPHSYKECEEQIAPGSAVLRSEVHESQILANLRSYQPNPLAASDEPNSDDIARVNMSGEDAVYASTQAEPLIMLTDVVTRVHGQHRSPFEEIYGANARENEEILEGVETLSHVPTEGARASVDIEDTVLPIPVPPLDSDDKLKAARGVSSTSVVLLECWFLAMVGAALLWVLFQMHDPQSTSSATPLNVSQAQACREVWEAIVAAEQVRQTSHDMSSMMQVTQYPDQRDAVPPDQGVHSILPSLLESDAIAACELVFEMLDSEYIPDIEIMDVASATSAVTNEYRVSVKADCELQGVLKQSQAVQDLELSQYLLGLAFVLLAVAFLQFDGRT